MTKHMAFLDEASVAEEVTPSVEPACVVFDGVCHRPSCAILFGDAS